MGRDIINEDDGFPIFVNTFSGGKDLGECVQITMPYRDLYTQMTRDDAIKFFKLALERLERQIEEDKINPPWWLLVLKKEVK
jgi:hypothetical protein